MTPELSIVVPVYNEAQVLRRFHERLSEALRALALAHEVIYVDDGSTDESPALIAALRAQDPCVGAVLLARNFGHQAALTAGLDRSAGRAVVTLDADLQHPPELIAALVEKWRAGAKIVHAVRQDTEAISPLKNAASRLYYRVINALSSTPVIPNAADFRLLDRQAVDALKAMPERHRFLRGMIGWLGLPEARVSFKAAKRAAGRSKYTWRRMARLAADGIVSFSTKPLRAALWLGLAALLVNLAYGAFVLYSFLFRDGVLRGWTSMILLVMFLGSSQLILLGVVGEYIGRIYDEIKARPLYLAREVLPNRLGQS